MYYETKTNIAEAINKKIEKKLVCIKPVFLFKKTINCEERK